jgi:23S rRNA pseudouridine1911/1915/1917 synthase
MKKSYKNSNEYIVEIDSYLLEYLYSKIEHKSKNNIKSILARGSVLVDGIVTTKYNYTLKKGQKVTIKLAQIYDKEDKETLDIIYEDDDLIVINKPAGLLTIATDNDNLNEKTAYEMISSYIKRYHPKSHVFIVHRLDRDTSGILVMAKNEKIKYLLQDNWNDIVTIRGYVAIVEGKVPKDQDTIKSWLKETKTQLMYSSNRTGDGKEAITHYHKLKDNNQYTLLEINIDTGRKNQIRVHMKDIGNCVIGDKKYGAQTNPLKRLGLHANILEFKHPINNKIMHFETPIPNEFMTLFK